MREISHYNGFVMLLRAMRKKIRKATYRLEDCLKGLVTCGRLHERYLPYLGDVYLCLMCLSLSTLTTSLVLPAIFLSSSLPPPSSAPPDTSPAQSTCFAPYRWRHPLSSLARHDKAVDVLQTLYILRP